jgi:anti-sigma factor RsiW
MTTMKMSDDSANTDFDDQRQTLENQLVPYLDGELDEEARRLIDRRLAVEPELRDALGRLERTWDMLDGLERSSVEDTFTQSTLEMVSLAAAEDVRQELAEAPRRRRRQWLVVSTSLLAAASAGFLITAMLRPNPNRELLENLPVLENLDRYSEINDIDFLRLLAAEDLFPAEDDDGR